MSEASDSMDIEHVLRMLPHRYPFLLVDRVLSCAPNESLVALKNVTINEPFFQGHFPGRPVMPGVLILEAMAQATGLLCFHTWGAQASDDSMYFLVGIDKARFKRPVTPGDQLRIEVRLLRLIRGIYRFSGTVHVGETLVSSAQLMTTTMPAAN